jgi:hypothetical protein
MGNENKNAAAAVMAKSPSQSSVKISEGQPSAATRPTRQPEFRTKAALDLTPRRFPHARKW